MLVSGAVLFVFLAVVDALMNGNIAELAMLPFTDMSFLSAVLYQGLGCSILAFFLSNAAISRIGVNRIHHSSVFRQLFQSWPERYSYMRISPVIRWLELQSS